jgi:hypothetical protein
MAIMRAKPEVQESRGLRHSLQMDSDDRIRNFSKKVLVFYSQIPIFEPKGDDAAVTALWLLWLTHFSALQFGGVWLKRVCPNQKVGGKCRAKLDTTGREVKDLRPDWPNKGRLLFCHLRPGTNNEIREGCP